MNIYLENKIKDFQETVDFFKKDIANLRTGRANLGVLDNVLVKAYDSLNPINALANLSVMDNNIIIAPWDKGVMKDIEKAVLEADLGLGVVNEGDKLRLSVPSLTEENRKDIVKKLNEKMEKARISFRQHRDEVKEDIMTAQDEKEISEDERFRFIKELDDHVLKLNEEIKRLRDIKEKDIMEI